MSISLILQTQIFIIKKKLWFLENKEGFFFFFGITKKVLIKEIYVSILKREMLYTQYFRNIFEMTY